jgi:hypothetical protein
MGIDLLESGHCDTAHDPALEDQVSYQDRQGGYGADSRSVGIGDYVYMIQSCAGQSFQDDQPPR